MIDNSQGYFRKAEVQATAAQHDSALLLYGRALQLQPNDMAILNAAKRVAQLSNRDAMRKLKNLFINNSKYTQHNHCMCVCSSNS